MSYIPLWADYICCIPEEKRKKYEARGLYSIWIEDRLVYIGKSKWMLRRICEHLMAIDYENQENKYKVLVEARRRGLKIEFQVIAYYDDEESLGEAEGEMIRHWRPPLNTCIPKEEDWRHWTVNKIAKTITLDEILNGDYDTFDKRNLIF